jgi:hypothetical protein
MLSEKMNVLYQQGFGDRELEHRRTRCCDSSTTLHSYLCTTRETALDAALNMGFGDQPSILEVLDQNKKTMATTTQLDFCSAERKS